MNKKGFTLIELLAVLVILAIIMGIAIPNIVSILDKNKKEAYIGDAKKFIALAKTEVSTRLGKPNNGEILKINLSCVDSQDVSSDSDGNEYDLDNSFVLVTKKDDTIMYYVNLISINKDNGNTKGIFITEKSVLDSDDRLKTVVKNVNIPTDNDIYTVTGIDGNIRLCSN